MAITICYLLVFIFESVILWLYCRRLFTSIFNVRTELLGLITCYFLLFLGSMIEKYWINFILFLSLNLLFMLAFYNVRIYTAFFHSMLITMIMSLTEFIVVILASHYSPSFYDDRTYFRNAILVAVIGKLLYFFLLQFVISRFEKNRDNELLPDKSSLFLNIISLISGFITLVFAIICTNYHFPLFTDLLITISAILLLSINLLLTWFHSYIQTKNQEALELQISLQKEFDTSRYYNALHEQDEKQKIVIHDMRRHLQSIAVLNEKGEKDKIADYIETITQSAALKETVQICDNPLLNSILYRTKQACEEHGIAFHTDIRSGIIDFVSEYDMTVLFDNLMENALDASQKLPKAFIELSITPHATENLIIITVINSCEENPFDTKKRILHTNKKNKRYHGYGLKSIEKTIKKYHGNSQYSFDETTHTFHSILLLNSTQITDFP